ncbi:hypothetical protein BV925_21855 [Pectobacterium odoriferum]|nr:hypothetical protein BV925_21855 [Pectobacterium odoriferum]
MRPLPEYPPYRVARPPDGKRWLSAGALMVLLCWGGGALLHPAGSGAGHVHPPGVGRGHSAGYRKGRKLPPG